MKRIRTKLIGLAIVVCQLTMFNCLTGCQNEHEQPDVPGTGTATVQLRLSTNGYEVINTRAVAENAVADITVLQFKEGVLEFNQTITDPAASGTETLTGMVSMAKSEVDENGAIINPTKANVVVCLANIVGNFPDLITVLGNGTIATYNDLLAYTATMADATAISDMDHIPMVGSYYGALAAETTNQMNVTLNRTMAKINFKLNTASFVNLAGTPVAVSVNKLELCNVPTEFVLFPQSRGDQYPVFSAGTYTTMTDEHNLTTDSKLLNYLAYMPANARGTHPAITHYGEKYPSKVNPTTPPEGWTYLLVELEYLESNGDVQKVTYKLYIGGDDNADINLLGGTQYNITAYIYGANADPRITVETVSTVMDLDLVLKQPANSYIVNSDFFTDIPVIPMQQAIDGWTYIDSKLGAPSNITGNLNTLLATDNWEVVTLWRTWNGSNVVSVPLGNFTDKGGSEQTGKFAYLYGLDKVPAGNNAVIALRSIAAHGGYPAKTIWWTWHLWFTDYNPDLKSNSNPGQKGQVHQYKGQSFTANYGSRYMMDRHLGATGSVTGNATIAPPATLADAEKWYGLMYQWGNKNPFTSNSAGTNTIGDATAIYDANGNRIGANYNWGGIGAPISISGNSLPAAQADGFPKYNNQPDLIEVNKAPNRLVEATRMPYLYLFNSAANYDWTYQDDDLWKHDVKTVFDPCPPGWRMPFGGNDANLNVWAGFSTGTWNNIANMSFPGGEVNVKPDVFKMYAQGAAYTDGTNVTDATKGRYYDEIFAVPAGTTKAWYPASGYRARGSGAFGGVGTYGHSWSAAASGANGFYLHFNSTVVYPQFANSRATGFPVRCLSE